MHRNLIAAIFLMIVTGGGLCGCNVIGPSFKPAEFDQNKEAVIYIYRTSGYSAGWLESLKLTVNNKTVGELASNGYGYVIVKPGVYKVGAARTFEWPSVVYKVVVTVAAGDTAYVRPYIAGFDGGLTTQIRLDDELIGARDIQKRKRQFGKRLDVESYDGIRMLAIKVETLTEGATRPTAQIVDELAGAIVSVRTLRGHGTGVIVSENGHCLTSRHVVGQTGKVQVIWPDGAARHGDVMRTDVETDSVMINIALNLPPATVASIAAGSYPEVGDKVTAICSPWWADAKKETDIFVRDMGSPVSSSASHTVRKGIVTSVQKLDDLTLIQTDFAIEEDYDGCPLINERGEVIGIMSTKLAGNESEGLGIAVPIVDLLKGLRVVASDYFGWFDKDNP